MQRISRPACTFDQAKQNIIHVYGKCSKILKTFLFLSSNKMLVFRAEIEFHKLFVRIANREDPDQTASSEAD